MLHALLDSGAEINLINQHVVKEHDLASKATPIPVAKFLNDHKMTIYGACQITSSTVDGTGNNRASEQLFFGADFGPYDVILGMPWLEEMDPMVSWKKGTFLWPPEDLSERIQLVDETTLIASVGVGETAFIMWPTKSGFSFENTALAIQNRGTVHGPGASRYVSAVAADEVRDTLPKQYWDFEDVFSKDLAGVLAQHSEYDHAIETEGKMPPHLPIYNLSQRELGILREYLDSALGKGWIRESKSPAGAPILFVPKDDGTMRLCVDYRGLNKITVKNRYPLPLISELLDRFSQSAIFTKLDLRDAYHRLRIKAGDEWKTAFRTRYGHYEYLVMPFGLANAPATFQNYIHKALGGLLDSVCVVYLDDILIYSKDEESHVRHVREVLKRLREWSLYAKVSKCAFHTTKIDFLGFIVTTEGVVMDPERVRAIKEWDEPGSFRAIQVFLGFANFYRRFIENYSKIAGPLNQLLAGYQNDKRKKFSWPPEAISAFKSLQDAFTHAPVLVHFVPGLPIMVITDASNFAFAGILLQPHGPWTEADDDTQKHWRPVAFFSKKFAGPEVRYDTHDKELMAIWASFKHWRHYLEGASHTIRVLTDHNNLRYFMTTKSLTPRQARWAEALSAFDFEIEFKKGTSNPADGLSRRPDYEGSETKDGVNLMLPTLQHKLRIHSKAINSMEGDEADAATSSSPTNEQVGHLIPSLTAMVASLREDHGTSTERRRNVSGALTGTDSLGYLVPRSVVVAAMATETAYEDSSNILINFIKGIQHSDDWARQEQYFVDPPAGSSGPSLVFKKGWKTDDEGLLRYQDRIWIPRCTALRQEIIMRNHDDVAAGHYGNTRTCEISRRKYWWQNMTSDVTTYIKSCDVCQRTKARRHKPYGEMQALQAPTRAWRDFSMDFVTDLPPSKTWEGKVVDSVLVVVDRFTKRVLYLPTTKKIDAPALADLIYREIVLYSGVPDSFVTDRGSVFTSGYWSTLVYQLKCKRRLSTAFHPQTDGQTERQNQELETHLRIYANWEQDDWAQLLDVAAFAYNSKYNSTIRMSPIEAAMGEKPNFPDGIRDSDGGMGKTAGVSARGVPAAVARVERMVTDRAKMQQYIKHAQSLQTKYFNKGHLPVTFEIGEKVLLSGKHIASRRPFKKLENKFLGPFDVVERIGKQAYRLKLPDRLKQLHDVFHVVLLEPYTARPGYEPPAVENIEEDPQWEVEKIVSHRNIKGKDEYLVKWMGWSQEHNQWMIAEDLNNAETLLEDFKTSNTAEMVKPRGRKPGRPLKKPRGN